MRELKLGSLFSGSGGFELAGVLNGITPVWASEIESFPIRVTKQRFPDMVHLGSVTDVNGAEVEPVDVITFGSPCQDLSVAGKQLGIHEGQRSSLFFEAIRIIKEMRDATTNKFPRFAVWENVPGAFGSNKGKDFQAVLQAFCEIGGGYEGTVPMPPKGRWLPAGCIVGDGWSIAWRVLNAEFFGVPQRRRRIYLIADFGSERAGEILAECQGLRWDSTEGFKAWKEIAVDAERSAGGSCAIGFRKSRRAMSCADYETWEQSEKANTLNLFDNTDVRTGEVICYTQTQFGDYAVGAGTIRASGGDVGGGQRISSFSVYDARGNGNGTIAPTLTGDHQNRITDYTGIYVEKVHDG